MQRQKSYENHTNLYLIPTPIGNLEDITLRCIHTLESVDFLLCEDTRVTSELLRHLNIKKKLIHCDDHNENFVAEMVVEKLKEGYNIGLVTDRGTPIISDPGYGVVKRVIDSNLSVVSLPGATAFVPALTVSGIVPSPFMFYGFLNSKEKKREEELKNLSKYASTLIFYESPHRLESTLMSMLRVLGDRRICLCREISKMYEEYIRGTLSEIIDIASSLKGEFVIIVDGNHEVEEYDSISIVEHVQIYLDDGMSVNDAIKKVAKERDIPKSVVYKKFHIDR